MIDKNFYFYVSISVDSYDSKKEAIESISTTKLAKKNGHSKKMSFQELFISLDAFEGFITSGHTYCGGVFRLDPDYEETFTTKDGGKYKAKPYYKDDGSLKAQFKSDRFFSFGQVFSIDIDGTRFNDPEDYVASLTLQPAFFYTSPSDDPAGLRKFRVVYVIDTPLNADGYELATKAIHKQAEVDTIEKIKDSCGERFSQYFNGNKKATCWKTYNVLTPDDLKPVIEKYGITLDEKAENEEIFSQELLTGMETLDYKDFMHFNSLKYEYFWTSLRFGPGEDYKILKPGEDIVLLFRWGEKFKDGEGRRKLLQKYACLRRIARPEITPSELLFNLYVDRERFFDNSDGALTLDCLKRKVEIAFSKDIEELKRDYRAVIENCPIKYVINPRVILKRSVSNKARKDIHWNEIEKIYDTKKSLKENLELLKNAGIKISKTTLYEYCKAKGISTTPDIDEKRKLIISLYDPSLSQNKNIEKLREHGIEITRTGMMKIVRTGSSLEEVESDSDIENTGIDSSCLLRNIIMFEPEKSFNPDFATFPLYFDGFSGSYLFC